MDELGFRAYLAKQISSVSGKPLSHRVIGNIVSRCKSVERRFCVDLDGLTWDPAGQRREGRGGYESVVPPEVQGDYLSAVRKYGDYQLASRRPSSASRS